MCYLPLAEYGNERVLLLVKKREQRVAVLYIERVEVG